MSPHPASQTATPGSRIAVVGSGIAGLSCAWLLSKRHDVTLYEADDRIGGHSNTVEAPTPAAPVAVDTGFIVYNADNYPNLVALFDHLSVPTKPAHMSFAVSMDDGAFEYSSHGLTALFAQKRNYASPKFWRMISDLLRFQKQAPRDLAEMDRTGETLIEYLDRNRYGDLFRDAHLLPQAAAIWSSTLGQMTGYPAASFVRFYMNHNLLTYDLKPTWRTVDGGSREYVTRLHTDFTGRTVTRAGVAGAARDATGATFRSGPATAGPSHCRRTTPAGGHPLPAQPRPPASRHIPDAQAAQGLGRLDAQGLFRPRGRRRRHLLDERTPVPTRPTPVRQPQPGA
jgi:hypothetical protein